MLQATQHDMNLSDTILKDGIYKCLSNAEALISDANFLKDNNRRERAYSLFQLGSEEIGKAFIIYYYMLVEDRNDTKAFKKFLKEFRDHKLKTERFISLDYYVLLAAKEVIKDKLKFLKSTIYELENIDKLNNFKNYSLYTTFESGQFRSPKDIITETDIKRMEFRTFSRFTMAKTILTPAMEHYQEIKDYYDSNPSLQNQTKLLEETTKSLKDLLDK